MPKTPAWCIFNYSFLTCGFARWHFGCASHLPAFAGLHHMARGRRDYVAFARIGTARPGHPGRNKHAGVANTLPRLQREYAALARIGPRVGISMLVARTRSRPRCASTSILLCVRASLRCRADRESGSLALSIGG